MPSRFPGPTYSCVRCGAVAKVCPSQRQGPPSRGLRSLEARRVRELVRARADHHRERLPATRTDCRHVWSAPYRPTTCRILPPAETDGASRTTLTAAASSQT